MKHRSLLGTCIVIAIAVIVLLSTACRGKPQEHTVLVLYAGSLAGVMENGLGPQFAKATGYQYQGEAQGSLGAARLIHDHLRTPDVFISADPAVNETILMGDGNQNLVTWYAMLASSQLVLAYNPNGKFAPRFEQAKAGTIPWYEVLETPGVKFGRGDPRIDPKGYRTLFLFDLAAKHYQLPKLRDLLGDPLNPDQVFPEIVLLARVESGQFDAGIFYKHEVVAHKLPYITFPPEISLGDQSFAGLYSEESYATPQGDHVKGAPILFTITIPKTVQHKEAAETFVRFMLGSNTLLEQFGLGSVEHRLTGSISEVPASIRPLTSTEPLP